MQFFLDTTDTAVLKELVETGLVDGVTTNPTLIAKSGRPMLEVIAEICAIVPGPISAEVAANVVVKIPLTFEGLKATRALADEGVDVNVTLCFSAVQALMAAKAGAAFISPFVGRLDDYGAVGMDLISEIRTIYDTYDFDTDILAASIRSVAHVRAAAIAGADCATLPPAVFQDMIRHPLTDKGLEQFNADWAKTGQSIL
jgi:transaldolase